MIDEDIIDSAAPLFNYSCKAGEKGGHLSFERRGVALLSAADIDSERL